jgi:hypothetical protein
MKKTAILSVLVLGLAAALVAVPVSAENLTGIVIYDSSGPTSGGYASGGATTDGGYGWNAPILWDANPLSVLNSSSSPGISVPLTAGANDFLYECPGTLSTVNYFDIDLFFGGSNEPGIAAILGPLTGGTTELEAFAAQTYALDTSPASNPINPDSLSFESGSTTITLTDFTFGPGDLTGGDYNYSGDIDLWVSNSSSVTPEPTSFLLLGSGLAGLAGMIRRKIKARA